MLLIPWLSRPPPLTVLLTCIDFRTECATMHILAQLYYALCTNKLCFFWQSMQKGDPSWSGYIYAFSIFAGVVWIIFVSCMLCTTFLCCFGVVEPTIIVLTSFSFFSHLGFLLRHSTFRTSCVWVSGWGPHWYVFLLYEELILAFCKRLYSRQASLKIEISCSTSWDHSYFYLGWLGDHNSRFVITCGFPTKPFSPSRLW